MLPTLLNIPEIFEWESGAEIGGRESLSYIIFLNPVKKVVYLEIIILFNGLFNICTISLNWIEIHLIAVSLMIFWLRCFHCEWAASRIIRLHVNVATDSY